jgi:hypothetical protein
MNGAERRGAKSQKFIDEVSAHAVLAFFYSAWQVVVSGETKVGVSWRFENPFSSRAFSSTSSL